MSSQSSSSLGTTQSSNNALAFELFDEQQLKKDAFQDCKAEETPLKLHNQELKQDYKRHSTVYNWICLYLGFFSYLGWSSISAYACIMASNFYKDELFYIIYITMTFFMGIMRIIYIQFLFETSYAKKIFFFIIVSFIAYILMIVSIFNVESWFGFYFCIASCALHGIAHSFGESVLLGFFRIFPSDAMNYFAFGTGFSQIFAIIMIFIFLNIGLFYGRVFCILILFLIPFGICFRWIHNKVRELIGDESIDLQMRYGLSSEQDEESTEEKCNEQKQRKYLAQNSFLQFHSPISKLSEEIDRQTKKSSKRGFQEQNLKMIKVFYHIRRIFYNQFIVTFTGDFIISFLVYYQVLMKQDYKMSYLQTSNVFVERYEYILLQFANAFGQFLSRSSTNVIIMRIPLSMSFLQAMNLIFLLLNMYYHFFVSFEFMFLFMMYSGYLAGSVYLNTFYIITQKKRKENLGSIEPLVFEEQEMALNLALIGMDLGYCMSAVLGCIMFNDYN